MITIQVSELSKLSLTSSGDFRSALRTLSDPERYESDIDSVEYTALLALFRYSEVVRISDHQLQVYPEHWTAFRRKLITMAAERYPGWMIGSADILTLIDQASTASGIDREFQAACIYPFKANLIARSWPNHILPSDNAKAWILELLSDIKVIKEEPPRLSNTEFITRALKTGLDFSEIYEAFLAITRSSDGNCS